MNEWPIRQLKDIIHNQQLTTAFARSDWSTEVFVLYDNNKRFVLIDFNDMRSPILLRRGDANVDDSHLSFIINNVYYPKSLNELINVKSVLTDYNSYIFISESRYCSVMRTELEVSLCDANICD